MGGNRRRFDPRDELDEALINMFIIRLKYFLQDSTVTTNIVIILLDLYTEPAPNIGDIGSRLGRQIVGATN